ncbi:sugar phosphate nucleotidyltransferase [Bacillus subtilis]
MRAVIMAGGKGMRLRPYTNVLPKPLIPLSKKQPILEIIIKQLCYHGFKRVTLTLNYGSDLIISYFGDGSRFGIHIDYILEEESFGTAGSLSLFSDLKEPFLLMNADILTDLDYSEFYEQHIRSDAVATVMLYHHQMQIDFGIIQSDDNGLVTDYVEKPITSHLISSGIYVFDPYIVNVIPKKRMDMPELIQKLLAEKKKVMSHIHLGEWIDIGTLPQFEKADKIFTEKEELFLKDANLGKLVTKKVRV